MRCRGYPIPFCKNKVSFWTSNGFCEECNGNRGTAKTLGNNPPVRASPANGGTNAFSSAGKGAQQGAGASIMGGCMYCGHQLCPGNCIQALLYMYQRQMQQAQSQGQVVWTSTGSVGSLGGSSQPSQQYPKKDIENGGIKVEDLTGWRIWSLTPTGLLKSFAVASIWLPNIPMEGDPDDHGTKGVWAFKSEDAAAQKVAQSPNHVMGSVRLWGHVIEHSLGYRAQFARIVSIDAISLPGKFPWDDEVQRALSWLRNKYDLVKGD